MRTIVLTTGFAGLFFGFLTLPAGMSDAAPSDVARLAALARDDVAFDLVPAFPALHFERPVGIAVGPEGEGNLFVIDQVGLVHAFQDDDDVPASRVLLDIRDRVRTKHFEEGLLGLAFSPHDGTEVFAYYIAGATGKERHAVVACFPVVAGVADPTRERIVLRIPQPYPNHNGGSLAFGPDGFLYIPVGDGGGAGDPQQTAQDLGRLVGKILRIDVTGAARPYGIPPDNPFLDRPEARPEIWAYGIRSPWQLSFDAATGEGWFGDVGQMRREEINRLLRGANYGWSVKEGTLAFDPSAKQGPDPFRDPVHEIAHDEGGSVIGGFVYRGWQLPELVGSYLFADFVTGQVSARGSEGEIRRVARSSSPLTAVRPDTRGEPLLVAFVAPPEADPTEMTLGERFRLPAGQLLRLRRRSVTPSRGFPERLSSTGLFDQTANHVLSPSVAPYRILQPAWNDGVPAARFVAFPGETSHRPGPPGVPQGSVLGQTFYLGNDVASGHRLETRLLVRGEAGWRGYSYRWLPDQSDAVRGSRAQRETVANQPWLFPSPSQCTVCHREGPLGLVGWQWQSDPESSVEARARAYLDVNCASCHRPGGTSGTRLDLRFQTPRAAMHAWDEPAAPRWVGGEDARILWPGRPDASEVLLRMQDRTVGHMPPIGAGVPDPRGIALLKEWLLSAPKPALTGGTDVGPSPR